MTGPPPEPAESDVWEDAPIYLKQKGGAPGLRPSFMGRYRLDCKAAADETDDIIRGEAYKAQKMTHGGNKLW